MILYTGGSFDCLHSGHIHFLMQCRRLVGKDGRVIVSLNTDDFIEKYKGVKPMFNYDERKELLEQCEYVDEVISNIGGADSKPAILQVNPNIIAIATDWAGKDYYKQMDFTQKWLDDRGIVLAYLPYATVISTTEIKRRLKG